MIFNFGLTRPANVGLPGGLPESHYVAAEAAETAQVAQDKAAAAIGTPVEAQFVEAAKVAKAIADNAAIKIGLKPVDTSKYPPQTAPIAPVPIGTRTLVAIGAGALALIFIVAKNLPKKKSPAVAGYGRRHKKRTRR